MLDPKKRKEAWGMHHTRGYSGTPAYKDGVVYAPFANELYAFDADARDGKDEGIKNPKQARPGDRPDILWKATLDPKAKFCKTSPLFWKKYVIIHTQAGLEFFPTRPRNVAAVKRVKLLETGGSYADSAAHDGKTIVAAAKDGLWAYDLESGRKLWTTGTRGTMCCIEGGRVFQAVGGGGDLVCYGLADGKELWRVRGVGATSGASPAVLNGTVYCGGGRNGNMSAFSAKSGEKLWSWTVPDKTTKVAKPEYGNAVYSIPLVTRDKVYFTSYSGYIYCLTSKPGAKKRLLWKHHISDVICRTTPLAYQNQIYVRGKGKIYVFGK